MFPGKDPGDLTQDQKQLISLLGTMAAGIAGGVVGNSTTAATTGAKAGKNAVENNYLSDKDITTFIDKYGKAKTESEREQLRAELKELDVQQQSKALAMGISTKDQKTELEKLRQLSVSPECTQQCRELAQYSISQLESVINDTALHQRNYVKAVTAAVISELVGGASVKSEKGILSRPAGTSAIDVIVKGGEQTAKNLTQSEIALIHDASNQLDKYVNSFAASKYKPATAISAVDPLTGKIVTTTNGAVPTIVAPELQTYADKLGGLGVKTACGNTLGRCAEYRAENELLLANPSLKLKDIQFTPAIRPRTGEVVPRCENCKNIF